MKTFAGFRLKETVKELKAIDAYLQESNETDSETFLREHFGMAELNCYQHKNANKLYVYFENGYVPGLNLITTASDDKTKLTPAKIGQTIHYYFSV